MHFLSTALALLPAATAFAIHSNVSHLDSDAYSARAWANQQVYHNRNSSGSWEVCNENNTTVRKEWYVYAVMDDSEQRH